MVVLNLGLVVGLGILLFDLKDPFVNLGVDNPEGDVLDDLFAEAVVVSLEDGSSVDIVSFTSDILVVALVDVS